MKKQVLSWTVIALLAVAALALFSANAHSQTPDTSYTASADRGSPTNLYLHYFTLTRRDSTMGFVLNGGPQAGSCANVWCALVPGTSPNSYGQSGGTFSGFNAAAHEVVRVWNTRHPGDTLVTPAPVDTTPAPTPAPTGYDTTYTQTRVTCSAGRYKTCYVIRQNGVEAGRVYQEDTTASLRWVAGRGTVDFTPKYSTLKAAARRVIDDWHITPVPPTPGPVDTLHVHYLIVTDTMFLRPGDSVTLQPDSNHIIIPVKVVKPDTVVITKVRVDTVKVPCDTPVVPKTGEPELPRYMKEMDAMVESSRAADTVTRQVFDQVPSPPYPLVARKDSLGRFVCNKIVKFDSLGVRWEKPVEFVCPQAVVDAVAARHAAERVKSERSIPVHKSNPIKREQ